MCGPSSAWPLHCGAFMCFFGHVGAMWHMSALMSRTTLSCSTWHLVTPVSSYMHIFIM